MMLDRAEVFFGCFNDLTHVRNNAHTVCAIGAVKFWDPIQVTEFLPVKNNVTISWDFWNFVNWKTRPLIKRHKNIEQKNRQNHHVDDGACDQVNGPRPFDQCDQANLVIHMFHKSSCCYHLLILWTTSRGLDWLRSRLIIFSQRIGHLIQPFNN